MPELAGERSGTVCFPLPPLTPSHKGEGNTGFAVSTHLSGLDRSGTAARFPSSLWEGVRGGGAEARKESILFSGNSPASKVKKLRCRVQIPLPLEGRG